MQYCENCRAVTDSTYCPLCGAKKLRLVSDGDFCLLTEEGTADCQSVINSFEDNGVPYSALPYGTGAESRLGLPLKNYRLFVPYNYYGKARSIVRDLRDRETEALRSILLNNVDNLNVLQKAEKKIRKKIKLPANSDFFDYCIAVIKSSYKIEDAGKISNCLKGGRYLFCYSETATLAVNSKTFEILSVTVKKH